MATSGATSGERRILLAMDGSSYADYAFDFYLNNIHLDRDYLILCHCVEYHQVLNVPLGAGSAEFVTNMIEDEKKKSEVYVTKLTEKMKEKGLHGKVKQVHGKPRVEILRVAEEEKVAIIVTGTRGMGQVRRTLLGSVSDHVLHHAHVPVLICRHEDDHKHHGHHGHHGHRGHHGHHQ